MEVEKALLQISEIHAHVLKSELYRGYRARTVALTGLVAVLGGALLQGLIPAHRPELFVGGWVALALMCAAIVLGDMRRRVPAQVGAARKRQAFLFQFLPSVFVGAALTTLLMRDPALAPLLPGMWVVLFGLGVLACRPYLPHQIGWVGLLYVCCGLFLLMARDAGPEGLSWALGCSFGLGQSGAALVLHFNLERDDHDAH